MIGYFFKTALSTLKYNKFRTFLTGLGVFVGVASVIIIISFTDSFSHHLTGTLSQKVTFGLIAGADEDVDLGAVISSNEVQLAADKIRRLDDVLYFEQAEGSKMIDVQMNDFSWQCGVRISFNDDVSVAEGHDFYSHVGNSVIAYGDESDDVPLAYKVGDSIAIDGIIYSVVGITNDISATLFFPNRLHDLVNYKETPDVAAFYLTTNKKNDDTPDVVLGMLNESLASNIKFVNYTKGDGEMIDDMFSSVTIFLSLIASTSLIVSAINIVNIMYISILERAEEIAIYRSMGMSKRMVVYLFLIEAMLIVAIFAVMGYIFGLSVAFVVLAIMNISLFVSLKSLILVVLISIILGMGAGIRPALKAAKTNLAMLLR